MTENRLIVLGKNGVGKSNLLESVELLGSLRSHRAANDKDLIKWNEERAYIKAIANDEEKLTLEINRKGGRKAYRNEKLLTRQLDFLGPLRCVGFSVLDLELIRGQPYLRRNWLDRVVQQLEPIYGELLSRFNRLLRQRSQLWRQISSASTKDRDVLLDAFDMQMALVSTRIHRRRRRVIQHVQPLAAQWQQRLSSGEEELKIDYLPGSCLEGDEVEFEWRKAIESQLFAQRSEEERLGSCKVGPHRDEINFLINGAGARRFGSAGQQRTVVLALKLAELQLIGNLHGESPILLLDDVLAELDPKRQLLLLDAVGDEYQCLISATHLDSFEGDWQRDSQLVTLDSLS